MSRPLRALTLAFVLAARTGHATDPTETCPPSAAAALRFPAPREGIAVFQGEVTACGKRLPALLVRSSLRDARLALAIQADPERGTRSLADLIEDRSRPLAVLSGGFLASYYPPMPAGFVKSGGRVLNRGRPTAILDGMLCLRRGGKQVVLTAMSLAAAAGYPECIQSGPLLVTGGRAVQGLRQRGYPAGFVEPTRRAFVAAVPGDAVVLGIIEGATLEDIAELAARAPDQGGLGATAALNLSGSSSAGLAVAGGPVLGNLNVLLPSAIVARR